MLLLQSSEIGRNWPDVLNTLLLILGPIIVILVNKWTAKGVKTELSTTNTRKDKQLQHIILLTNSTLSSSQKHNEALTKQLEVAGIAPVPAPAIVPVKFELDA